MGLHMYCIIIVDAFHGHCVRMKLFTLAILSLFQCSREICFCCIIYLHTFTALQLAASLTY